MKTSVLFICTANSARSLMAEALLRQLGGAEVTVASAGTEPDQPHPQALAALQAMHVTTEGLRSKSLADLEQQSYDYVISLCDKARQECSADYQQQHFIAWDFPDPVQAQSPESFLSTAKQLSERIRMFLMIVRKRQAQPHLFNAPQELFKILADPLRLTMTLDLADGNELCVCEFVERTRMSQPKVSRHLAQLRAYGLLVDRRDQRWVYYRLNPALPDWMRRVIQTTANYHVTPHS